VQHVGSWLLLGGLRGTRPVNRVGAELSPPR
jgi:hypothetical protein